MVWGCRDVYMFVRTARIIFAVPDGIMCNLEAKKMLFMYLFTILPRFLRNPGHSYTKS